MISALHHQLLTAERGFKVDTLLLFMIPLGFAQNFGIHSNIIYI